MINKTGTPSWNQQHFIRICAITNVVTWGLMLGQYIWYFSITGAIFIAVLGEFYIMCLGVVLSLFTWWFPRLHSRFLKGFAGIIHLVLLIAFLFLALLFNGPFGVPLFIIEVAIAFLNFMAFIEHVTSWKDSPSTPRHELRAIFPRAIKSAPAIAIAALGVLGLLSLNSFWMTITIRAPDDARTTSSYWGNPELNVTSWSATIKPVDNWTLQVTPARLNSTPAGYANGSLAYVEKVFFPANVSKNYADYLHGARSYPNGTMFLSEPLPTTATNASIRFQYVTNWNVLQMLGASNATVILNGFGGNYLNDPNPFHYIGDTNLFQLLDYWHVKFYGQISFLGLYSNVFNYLDVTPLAHLSLEWAMQWQQFQGVSFDSEQEEFPQPEANKPGYVPLFPGSSLPDSLSSIKQLWYWMNEQNETLFAQARAAYDAVFQHAIKLGKSVYIVLGPSDFSEYIDGDDDYHSNPAIPFSNRPNVLYAQMSYRDVDANQFALYRDCVESIKQLGNRGSSILMGWVNDKSSYYSPDATGFQNYVSDCLVAQAAGITEIFHAPIYKIQKQWGDDAILRLDQALNTAQKKTIVIRVMQFTNFFIWDFWKNFNRPFFYITVLCGFVTATLLEVSRSRKMKEYKA